MKFKDVLFIVLLVCACGFFYMLSKKETNISTDHKIDSLYRANRVLINFDSVRQAMEAKIIDSVNQKILLLNKKIDINNKATKLVHEENLLLRKEFDRVVVDRPDF